jgi:uncharacterized protein (DUF1499 family)
MYRTIGALGLVCLVLGPLLAHVRAVPPLVGLIVFTVSGFFGALAVVLGAVGLLRRRGRRPLVGLLLGLVPVACLLVLAAIRLAHPPIPDVSTDLADPPALARAPAYPGELAPVVRAAYPDLGSLVVDAPPAVAFQEAMELAAVREGWTVARAYDQAMSFEGVAETWLFRFRDDFAVRVRARGDETVIDMRSRSRDGKGDVGTNARRIRAFLAELRARLQRAPGAAR